jgi:hypothetical protein
MSFNNIPNKGDIIINPNTQRPVRVGGRTWLNLVKQGLVEGKYTDSKELAILPEESEDVDEELKRINDTLPRGQQAVRGRGRYKGKIVSRNQRPDTEEIIKYTAQTASKIVNDIDFDDCDDLEAELERLILEEMANNSLENQKYSKKEKPEKPKLEQFELQEPELSIEEDEEDTDYFIDEDSDTD